MNAMHLLTVAFAYTVAAELFSVGLKAVNVHNPAFQRALPPRNTIELPVYNDLAHQVRLSIAKRLFPSVSIPLAHNTSAT
jgi:hypothetical protein